MRKSEQKLWISALEGDKAAYRKLGILFLKRGCRRKNKRLAELCLEKAAELGDEKGYVLYCRMCAQEKIIMDRRSYFEMYQDYLETKNPREKRVLSVYLGFMKLTNTK